MITYSSVIGLSIGNRPFNMLNDIGFRMILKSVQIVTKQFGLFDLDQAICVPSTAGRRLPSIFTEGMEELKSLLLSSNIHGLSITSDHWKGANHKTYLSFTLSYANMEEECITTRYLSLEEVPDKRNVTTGERTKQVLEQHQLNSFRITFTTDNAMVGAYNTDYKDKHCCCLSHSLALFQRKAFYNSTSKGYKSPTEIVTKISRIFTEANFEQKVDAKMNKQYNKYLSQLSEPGKDQLRKVIRTIMIAKHLVSVTFF